MISYVEGGGHTTGRVLRNSFTVVSSLVALSACGDDVSQSAIPARGWDLEPEPVVVLGVVDGAPEYLFGDIASVHLTAGEELVVVDRGVMAIRLYDIDGQFLRQIGGLGEGPGEFQRIAGAWFAAPDTIRIYDIRYPRLATFLLDGTFIGATRLEDFVGHPDLLVGGFHDGSVVLGQANFGDSDEPVIPDVMWYDEYTVEGNYRGRVAVEKGMLRYEAHSQTALPLRLHPFSGYAQAVIYRDSLFYTNGTGGVRVWARGGRGAPERTIPLPKPRVTVEEAWTRLRRTREALGSTALSSDIPELERIPEVARILIDDRGLLWAQRFRPGKDSILLGASQRVGGGEWWVMNLKGEVQTTLTLPPQFTPHEVRGDYVVGIMYDELQVQRVAVYRIAGRDVR